GLAGIAGLYAARGWARRLIGVLVAGGGVFSLVAVWGARRSESLVAAIGEHATGAAGAAQVTGDPGLHTAGPAMAAVGAGLPLLSGLVAAVRAPAWPGMGTRYDRGAAPRPHQAETPSDLWKSLDAGDDPTLHSTPASSAARPTEPKESTDGS